MDIKTKHADDVKSLAYLGGFFTIFEIDDIAYAYVACEGDIALGEVLAFTLIA